MATDGNMIAVSACFVVARSDAMLIIHPYNAELFLYKPWRLTVFFSKFQIIINVIMKITMAPPGSFEYLCYDHYQYFYSFSAGIVFIPQNLTSIDVSSDL